jgi:hypothetical protein
MPDLPPRILSALDQYQIDARDRLARDVTRYYHRGWTLVDQIGEYADADHSWLVIMLGEAIHELAGLSKAMGMLTPKDIENA